MMFQFCQERCTHLLQAVDFLFNKVKLALYQFVSTVQLSHFCCSFSFLPVRGFDLPALVLGIQYFTDVRQGEAKQVTQFFNALQVLNVVFAIQPVVSFGPACRRQETNLFVVPECTLGQACTRCHLLDAKHATRRRLA